MTLNQIFSVDPGSVLWTLLTFILLLVILGKFAWGPILQGLKNREDGIRQDLEQAASDRQAAEDARKGYEANLNEARAESQKMLAESRERAKRFEADQMEAAKAEAQAEKEKARRELELERQKVLQNAQDELVDLSLSAAETLLQKSLDRAAHEDLIRSSLKSGSQA